MEFIHPWYMVAGGALVSSPILIHLINRMRFKRLRWAAMEFLLKSQKRNRRRLIIEQMILLLLRILLVLLAGFLVARLLYAGTATKGATHVMILDDTVSMTDKDDKGKTAFEEGRRQVLALAEKAGDAQSAQFLKLYLLSDLNTPVFDGRLGRESHKTVAAELDKVRKGGATLLHASPLEGLKKARALLSEAKQGAKQLHFVSDFRDRDWTEGPDADNLAKEVQGAIKEDVGVIFVDVAGPFRERSLQAPRNHNNLAVVDFTADQRVALPDSKVEFTVTIKNFGVTEPQPPPTLTVRVNGDIDKINTQQLPRIPAGGELKHKFDMSFQGLAKPGKEKEGAKEGVVGPKETDEEKERKRRLDRYYYHVQVDIGEEKEGLTVDNCRDLIMEVRQRVPTLIVDGNKKDNRGERSDIDLFTRAIGSNREFEVQEIDLDKLEKIDLSLYPSIILLNMAELPEHIVKRLKAYVEGGGTLCYFLGEEVKPAHYNEVLFPAGLFPVKLERIYDPLVAQDIRDPEERRLKRLENLKVSSAKVLFPDGKHSVVSTIALLYQGPLQGLGINVYWKAQPRRQWDPERKLVDELIVLPNPATIDLYKARAQQLPQQALREVTKLANNEAEYKKYIGPMADFGTNVLNALTANAGAGSLPKLAQVLDDVLNAPGEKDNPAKPKMPDLWQHLAMRDLANQLREFRDTVLYGDPILVTKAAGKGRVLAMMIPPGTIPRKGVDEDKVAWNNWGEGERYLMESYALLMNRLQVYLVSEGGQVLSHNVGQGLELKLPARLYAPKFSYTYTEQPEKLGTNLKLDEGKANDDTMTLVDKKQNYLLKIKERAKPGVLRLYLTLVDPGFVAGDKNAPKEMRAYAYNIDAAAESNLKRAGKDRLDPPGPGKPGGIGVVLRSPKEGGDIVGEVQPDASLSPWLYLFFIIILVVEQALAVHLSFHLKGNESAPGAAQSAPAAAA